MIKLRYYQEEAINSAIKNENGIVVCPTGTGKSVIIAGICQKIKEPILILQPSKEILEQNFEKIKSFTAEDLGIYSASKGKKEINRITLATIGSIKDIEQFKYFKTILIDECFVAGTKIDGKNIEDVQIGDLVDSFNHKLNIIEKKRVLAVRKIWHTENLQLTNILDESIVSTLSHPIFNGNGYVEAQELKKGDYVYVKNNLPPLRKRGDFNVKMENSKISKYRKGLLLNKMWKKFCELPFIRTNEKAKPNVSQRNQRKNGSNIKKNRTQAKNTRGKWEGNDRATKFTFRQVGEWLVSRVNNHNQMSIWQWLPLPLQNRLSKPIENVSNRSGRLFSLLFKKKKTGPEKNIILTKSRVESVKILKPTDYDRYRKGCYVYNLEVEDNNNYFANNILVHNCHLVRSDAGKYCDFINEVKPTKIIGLTATPYRLKSWSGGYSWKFLHRTRPKIFNNIIYNYQIKQAFEDKFLCPLEYFKFDYDLTKLRQTKMDYTEDSVVEYNESINIYETIINIIKTNISRKYFLVFATTINEANKICNLLLKENISGYYVSSNNTRKEREEILNNFISGKVKFIINVGVLTTGFDFPELDCIILARPTKSLSLYYQMVGRGVRIAKDKNKCQVFDLCNNYETFGDLTTFEIEGDGAKTGLKNSDKWLIKPSLLSIKEAVNGRKQNKNYFEVPFGKYKGCSIAEVPVSYINYCLDNFIDFKYKEQFEKALKSNF